MLPGAIKTGLRRVASYARANSPLRRAFANRTVRRRVQGVELYLPWSHRLPDYAWSTPTYGQNLVELAAALGTDPADQPLRVVDVGANIGDSALQILARTPARVLCVEGDPYWSAYLRRNVGDVDAVTVVECFLTAPDLPMSAASPVRSTGTTTHFVEDAASTVTSMSIGELRAQYPDFASVRLIKSDTDGLDVALVPELISTWRDCDPVVFFEFDPGLTRAAGFAEPDRLWERLSTLGYSRAAAWDNAGRPVGQFDVIDGARHAAVLAEGRKALGYHFWDVAVRRDTDAVAARAFDVLVPKRLG